jgi:NAD(P)-dependent dehydrogenase (short-subunit alcohol dehydrogenase family)
MSESKKKVVIITGANSGIGFKAAELLCQDGYEVILACRNPERGTAAAELIKSANQKAEASFMQVCIYRVI